MNQEHRAPADVAAQTADAALYPACYTWFVFLAAMDILFTALILSPAFEGIEINYLANWVIARGGYHAAIAYKLILVSFVILICEIVGRRRHATGRRLAEWAVAISCIPVTVAYVQLAADVIVWALNGTVVDEG